MTVDSKRAGALGRILALGCLVMCLSAGAAWSADSSQAAYVRKSPRDARYFELTNGEPYIPIGFNLVGAPDEEKLESVLDVMAANKVNYCRVWLDQKPWQVEHERAGVYDESKVKTLRRFLDMAQARGIRVKLCLEYFRDVQPSREKWSDNLMQHRFNGGPFGSMEDYLYSTEGQERFRRKLAFYREHIGDHPAVFAWELWNEMNAVKGDWAKWTTTMLPELHRLFPKNMAVQSLGSFDHINRRKDYKLLLSIPGNDVAQVHRYLDLGAKLEACHGPVDVLGADAVRELIDMEPERPVILAESGAVKPNHTGVSPLYAKDKDGMLMHDIIFAPFFAGAAGTGAGWWWSDAIQKPNQWHHFARFARAVEGIDPAAEHFEPIMLDHPSLRVYALKGKRTLLVWCRDKRNDWTAELERGEAPERLSGVKVNLGGQIEGRGAKASRAYDPWSDAWTDLALEGGTVTLPAFQRSVVVKIQY